MKLFYTAFKIWMLWKLGHETPTEDDLNEIPKSLWYTYILLIHT
jgi:hypothetical protein